MIISMALLKLTTIAYKGINFALVSQIQPAIKFIKSYYCYYHCNKYLLLIMTQETKNSLACISKSTKS
ncbi:hypothetical protein LguiA_021905 [Lonicera macranthoides]